MRLSRVKNIAELAFKACKRMLLSMQVSCPAATEGKPQLSSPFATKLLTLWGDNIHPDSSLMT